MNTFFLILSTWFLGFLVVIVRSPIQSILFLILLFTVVSLSFIINFGLQFVGILYIIVYVGAIAVLFIFIIIIIPMRSYGRTSNTSFIGRIIRVVALTLFLIILFFYLSLDFSLGVVNYEIPENVFSIPTTFNYTSLLGVGHTLYFYNFFSLLIGALILLVALLIAIVLCKDE